MNRILVIAEHDGARLNPATARTVQAATGVDGEIDIAVFGSAPATVADQAARLAGVSRVLAVSSDDFAHPLAVALAPEIVTLAADYTHVLAPSTTFGKDLLPRVAALLGVNQVSDIMEVRNARTFRRPMYAGNAIVTVQVPEGIKVVGTVRTASWAAAIEGGTATVEPRAAQTASPTHTRFVGLESGGGDRPDLQTATVVVSGGRALGSEENFAILYRFADRIGAAVGASRAAVDAGYVPNDLQVGQTGKIIAPDLYFAFGISGAIQHLTGIKDSGCIVAINKDADAPIFEIADIGLVGDLFEVVPELEALLAD